MKKLVFSACALTLTGSVALANDSDWAQLDKDVQALSASLQDVEGTGVTIGGRIRVFYDNSGDVQPNGPLGNDLGGFTAYNARLYAHGTTSAGVGYRLENDFATGLLLDAFIDVNLATDINLRIGQFRGFVLNEAQIDSGNLFFADRSQVAAAVSGRGTGAAVTGNFDAFEFGVTVQNGGDGIGDDLFYAIRGGIAILGEGTQLVEGAYGAGDEMEASAGIAFFSDDAVDDADGVALEATLASNMFSLQAAVLSLGDVAITSTNEINEVGVIPLEGDTTPWSIGGTFMLTDGTSDYGAWELGARFQDLDDSISTRLIDIGANYYADGHNMKYTIGWTQIDVDGDNDVSLFRLGVNTRF